VRERYLERWRYLHIDEYQDTNAVQEQLAELLVGPQKNICVVGDPDQTIYGWRGAKIENILHFERKYPGAKVVMLEENYRSTKKHPRRGQRAYRQQSKPAV
jgi:DNA helicase-2/ATP-dependent DNA helicase PcrA